MRSVYIRVSEVSAMKVLVMCVQGEILCSLVLEQTCRILTKQAAWMLSVVRQEATTDKATQGAQINTIFVYE